MSEQFNIASFCGYYARKDAAAAIRSQAAQLEAAQHEIDNLVDGLSSERRAREEAEREAKESERLRFEENRLCCEEINKRLAAEAERDRVVSTHKALMLEQERKTDETESRLAAVLEELRTILPMAKGYAVAHPVGNNAAMIESAERALQLVCAHGKAA